MTKLSVAYLSLKQRSKRVNLRTFHNHIKLQHQQQQEQQ